MLEAREVPATNYWQNIDTHSSNPANWSDGVPTPDDGLVFRPRLDLAPPGEGGDPPPPPPPPVSTGTTFPTTATQFAGIRFVSGYAGTVTLPVSITFGGCYQDCGATVQAGNTTLTAMTSFAWTGGAVNASGNAATYKLDGATGGVIGTETSSLTTGSTLTLEANGSIGTSASFAGTTWFDNEADLKINAFCQVLQQPVAPAVPVEKKGKHTDPTKNTVYVYEGGKYVVDQLDQCGLGISILGGLLDIQSGKLTASGKVNSTNNSITMDHGLIQIANGQDVEVTYGLSISNGTFKTFATATDVDPTVTITGDFTISGGGIIVLGMYPDNTGYKFAKLKVIMTFTFAGGEFRAAVDAADGSKRDRILAEDIGVSVAAKIKPTVVGDASQAIGRSWDVLVATNSLTVAALALDTIVVGTGWDSFITGGNKRVAIRKLS